MIERIALYRLHTHVERTSFASRARIDLSAVSGLASLSVGLPSDASAEKSWDVSIVMRFVDVNAEALALASDTYQRCEKELLLPSAHVWKAWSFVLLR